MIERRHNPRINIEIDVEYNMSSEQDWFNANTKNLSSSGICIITKTSFLPGLVMDIKFKLPDSTRIIEVTGEIIWQEYMIEKDYFTTGIRFTEIKLNDIELINKYIENTTFILRD